MPITVKALQKFGPDQPFKVTEIERRDPREDDVVIKIEAAGICHSDIHTIHNEWGQAHFPLAVGHEIAGTVEAVGSAVTKFKVGDRVGVGCLVNSCGECEQCAAGFENNCLNGSVGTYNSKDVDGTITQGGYAQKVTVNERFVMRIPDALDFDVAAPLLCAGITTYSPLARWGVKPGMKVAVMGLGGLGHMGVQIAAAMGAEVTVLSRNLKKADAAAQLGAARTLATTDENFFTDHRGEFDLIHLSPHQPGRLPGPAQAPRHSLGCWPAPGGPRNSYEPPDWGRQGADRQQHRRHSRDPGDAGLLRRARYRRRHRKDRRGRGRRRLRACCRRRRPVPRGYRHRNLRQR